MKTSEQITEIIPALTSFQAEVEIASKDSKNPHFKSTYADLTSIWNAVRPYLAKNHLVVIQSPSFDDQRVVLTTRIFHKSGQWIENTMSVKAQQDTPQAIGSCITYLRRYVMASMLGVVADEDDDGHEGSRRVVQENKYTSPKPEPVKLGQTYNHEDPNCKKWFWVEVSKILPDAQKDAVAKMSEGLNGVSMNDARAYIEELKQNKVG